MLEDPLILSLRFRGSRVCVVITWASLKAMEMDVTISAGCGWATPWTRDHRCISKRPLVGIWKEDIITLEQGDLRKHDKSF
jgi:hypothetical protein